MKMAKYSCVSMDSFIIHTDYSYLLININYSLLIQIKVIYFRRICPIRFSVR
jgi:hypothetical protein